MAAIHSEGLKRMHGRLRTRQDLPVYQVVGYDLQYACTSRTYSRRTILEIGGHEVEVDLVLGVLKTEFFVVSDQTETGFTASQFNMASDRKYPRTGMNIIFAGRTFRIEMVHDLMPIDPTTQLILACVSVTK